MSDRFKVGDVLIVTGKNGNNVSIGTEVMVLELDGDGVPKVSYVKGGKVSWSFVDDDHCELLEVYNSPLYNALK